MRKYSLRQLLPWIVLICLSLGMFFGYKMAVKLYQDDNHILYPSVD